nr:MAG TPA: hypothetical protein [Bacteriophage sp.]
MYIRIIHITTILFRHYSTIGRTYYYKINLLYFKMIL